MKRITIAAFICMVSVASFGLVTQAARHQRSKVVSVRSRTQQPPRSQEPIALPPTYNPAQTAKTVAFYEERARQDPEGAITHAMLASWYLRRCRETGDIMDAARAEKSARRSVALRDYSNAAAYNTLAQSLLTQHRFKEARDAAGRAAETEPNNRQAAYLMAEANLEIGEYAEVGRILRAIAPLTDDPFGTALRARLAEIDGAPELALRLYRKAQEAADKNRDIPRESAAWFHMRVGNCLAAMGRADEAEQSYREAIILFPRDYRTMACLTRLKAGQGAYKEALTWGSRAESITPVPETAALLGDVHALLGDKKAAKRQYRLAHLEDDEEEEHGHAHAHGSGREHHHHAKQWSHDNAHDQAHARLHRLGILHDRQRALFLADHDRNLKEALAIARRELKTRHDIYTHDTLAWACFKNGLLDEASAHMEKALARGTRDALLFYHAGRIAEVRGNEQSAREYLSRALTTDPYFHPLYAKQVQTLLNRPGK